MHSPFVVDKSRIRFKSVNGRDTQEVDWDASKEYAITCLRALWAEGHSTAEIGRRMGISKNAVVGKAHRLNLPARPSPIRRDVVAVQKPLPQRDKYYRGSMEPTLPPMMAAAAVVVAPRIVGAAERSDEPSAQLPMVRLVATASRPFPRVSGKSCCWPSGEPGTPSFSICDNPELVAGKPYCAAHCRTAYVKPRDRRDDGAKKPYQSRLQLHASSVRPRASGFTQMDQALENRYLLLPSD